MIREELRAMWRISLAVALVLSFSLVATTPVAAANGPPVASGLVLHLDADAIEGLTDGEPVETWEDQSGQNNHATQGTPADQPEWVEDALAGKPVVRFDGTGEHLLLPDFEIFGGDQNLTIMVVFKANTLPGEDDWENNEVLLNFRNERNIMLCFGDQDGDGDPKAITIRAQFAGSGWTNPVVSNTLDEGTAYLIGVDYDTTSGWRLFNNGALEDTVDITETIESGTDISAVGGASDGDNRWYDGDIAEILIYDRALTTQERVDMEWYLGEKWLGWERPAEVWVCDSHGDDGNPGTFDHPFKTIQHGVTVVAANGIVNVKAGTHTGSVTIERSLTLRSTDGTDVTTITGLVDIYLDDGQIVVFGGAEDAGFTIDRGNPIPDSGILLSLDNGSGVTISHNTITGSDVGIRSETTFTIAGGSTVVIEDNKIIGNDGHGIYMGWIRDDSTVRIDSNQITDNGGAGIYIGCIGDALMTVTIAGNTITDNAGHGIHLDGVLDSTLVVEDNMIAQNGRFGIDIWEIYESTVVIDQNVVGARDEWKGNDDGGINIGSVLNNSSLQITANHANENCADYFGIQINIIDGSTVNIEDNETNGNVNGIIVHSVRAGGALYVVGNTIAGNHYGLHVSTIENATVVVVGNWIEDNNRGITIGGVADSTARINFNNIFDNTEWGVLYNGNPTMMDATHNWWGHASGPFHDTHNQSGMGDEVSDNVDFTPWLGAAITDQDTGCTADRATGENAFAETDNVSATASGGGTDTTVTVAEYVGDPSGVSPGFIINDVFFFDVHVGGTDPDTLIVEVKCPGADCSGVVLKWFDGTVWWDVAPVSYTNGTIVATLDGESSPTIAQLTGTRFGAGNPVDPVVGGTAQHTGRLALLLPWILLGAAIIAGAAISVRRRLAQS